MRKIRGKSEENSNIFLKKITNFSDAREYLRTLREDNVRSSDDVVDIYDAFIRDGNPSDLGDERWMVLEQVVVAGFDTHRIDIGK